MEDGCALCLRTGCGVSAPPLDEREPRVWVCHQCKTVAMQTSLFVMLEEEIPERYIAWMGERQPEFLEWAEKRNRFITHLLGYEEKKREL